jgi:hypothetical protein
VDSLRIHTNMRVTETFGGPGGGVDFFYQAPIGFSIIGFVGRSGLYLDAIGVVVRLLPGLEFPAPSHFEPR